MKMYLTALSPALEFRLQAHVFQASFACRKAGSCSHRSLTGPGVQLANQNLEVARKGEEAAALPRTQQELISGENQHETQSVTGVLRGQAGQDR